MSTRTRKKRRRKPGTEAATRARAAAAREKARPSGARPRPRRRRRGLGPGAKAAGVIALAVGALGVLFYLNRGGGSSGGGEFAYEVGSPGPGQTAPDIRLPSTEGGTFDLASMRGKTVLLYFQEGLMCQPCWDQLVDVEAEMGRFQDLGIDEIVTITTDPLDGLRQKVADEGISTLVLSDQRVAVSQSYSTNQYGMMGEGFNGHSFIVVGPDGTILWRADYGGPPDHTMYLPVDSLIADLREGLREAS